MSFAFWFTTSTGSLKIEPPPDTALALTPAFATSPWIFSVARLTVRTSASSRSCDGPYDGSNTPRVACVGEVGACVRAATLFARAGRGDQRLRDGGEVAQLVVTRGAASDVERLVERVL